MKMHPSKLPIPVQELIQDNYVRLERLRTGYHPLSPVPHKHDHYELIWIHEGVGNHYINFKAYPFIKNRIYLIQTGQVHAIPEFYRDGWIFMISEGFMRQFFSFHPSQEGQGIFDVFGSTPYIDLTNDGLRDVENEFSMLREELAHPLPDREIVFHRSCVILLKINKLHISDKKNAILLPREREILVKLKELLNQHYRQGHKLDFFRRELGIPMKLLNRVCKKASGKTLHHLVHDKLLAEAIVLLLTDGNSIKEIAFELGFEDPAYFSRFFRRYTGMTPVKYRSQNA